MVKPGMTEALWPAPGGCRAQHGADEGLFEPLVQSGLNAAFPHGASKRAINLGDGLLMDFGFRPMATRPILRAPCSWASHLPRCAKTARRPPPTRRPRCSQAWRERARGGSRHPRVIEECVMAARISPIAPGTAGLMFIECATWWKATPRCRNPATPLRLSDLY